MTLRFVVGSLWQCTTSDGRWHICRLARAGGGGGLVSAGPIDIPRTSQQSKQCILPASSDGVQSAYIFIFSFVNRVRRRCLGRETSTEHTDPTSSTQPFVLVLGHWPLRPRPGNCCVHGWLVAWSGKTVFVHLPSPYGLTKLASVRW